MKVFVPFSEALIDELGPAIGELVPYRLEYRCMRAYGPADERGLHEREPNHRAAAEPGATGTDPNLERASPKRQRSAR